MMPYSLIDMIARPAAGTVLNSLWQGLALTMLTWLVLRIFPRANAATRHAIWATALGAVALLPFVELPGSLKPLPAAVVLPQAPLQLGANWAMPLCVLWAAVAGILLLRLLWSYAYVCWLARTSTPLPALYQRQARRLTGSAVGIRVSRHVSVPVAIGLRRPAILLPETLLNRLSEDELDQILIHEWSHICRRDHWLNLAQELLQAVFFFQPAVWWICRRLRVERELACDDAVVSATGRALPYAGCLTKLVEFSSSGPEPLSPAAVRPGSEVVRRVERLVRGESAGNVVLSRLAWLGASAALLLAAGLSRDLPAMVALSEPPQASASWSRAEHMAADLRRLQDQNRLADERLRAADETLRAARQQLAAAHQAMRRAQQQMIAADQRMQQADEQLRASRQMSLAGILGAHGWLLPPIQVSCPAPASKPLHRLNKI
jgi:beta-lactamase regulating signal transducer with metallopeptidase domain